MQLRPYQNQAVQAIFEHWGAGVRKTLLVLPTGTGKTVVFAKVIENIVGAGGRALILAHRAELLQQAADKLGAVTGLKCGVEQADQTAAGTWYNVVVGSVQTMQREARRTGHDFTHVIVDEAHHAVSPSYRAVLDEWPDARVLGVTATADRGDKRSLGEVFESVAYEYILPQAVREGYLCRILTQTIPLSIDIRGVRMNDGDLDQKQVAHAIDPYLERLAVAVREIAGNRKSVAFLPLCATAQKFREHLRAAGMRAYYASGEDRTELAAYLADGQGAVLCNAMLLNEGWDHPQVDCVIMARPTKIRSLYAQMAGRGTRLHPGKRDMIIIDPLWMHERLELCRPAHLVCEDPDISRRVAEILAADAVAAPVDVLDTEPRAEGRATAEREAGLAKQLELQKHKKRELVDPLQFTRSIKAPEYRPPPNDLRAHAPPTLAQVQRMTDLGIYPGEVVESGHAAELIRTAETRHAFGMSTPRQIRLLEGRKFQNVGTWTNEQASSMIGRLAAAGWGHLRGVNPRTYKP